MLSAFMGFIEEGDEVIVFEPFFDQYENTHVSLVNPVYSCAP